MRNQKTNRLIIAGIVALLVASFGPVFRSDNNAQASTLPQFSKAFVRLNRMLQDTVTGGTVCALTPATAVNLGTEAYVDVGFPSQSGATNDFIVNATAANWTVNTVADPDTLNSGTPPDTSQFWPVVAGVTASAWPGIGTAAVSVDTTNRIVRFTTTALSASTWYCFNFGNALTTADAGYVETSPGYVETYQTDGVAATPGTGTAIMRTNWATETVANEPAPPAGTGLPKDQIVVTAVVPPLFQFELGATVDTVPAAGNLNYQALNESGGVTVTVHTNAKSGWIAWSKSANQGLVSASAGGYTITTVGWNAGAPTTLTAGVDEKYGLIVTWPGTNTSTCTTSIAPEYNPAGANDVGRMTANFQQIASCSGGTSDGDTITLKERVTIKSVTPAATDYTDTLTVVGAGDF